MWIATYAHEPHGVSQSRFVEIEIGGDLDDEMRADTA